MGAPTMSPASSSAVTTPKLQPAAIGSAPRNTVCSRRVVISINLCIWNLSASAAHAKVQGEEIQGRRQASSPIWALLKPRTSLK